MKELEEEQLFHPIDDETNEHDERDRVAMAIIAEINTSGIQSIKHEIPESIDALTQFRERCSMKGQYQLCEAITKVIELLKEENDQLHVKQLYKQQEKDRMALVEAYTQENEEFINDWTNKIEFLKAEIETLKQALFARHSQEMEEFIDTYHEELRHRTPKFSKQLLNLRKIQETLAKKRDFAEALRVKKTADALQNEELVRLSMDQGERFEKKRTALIVKHRQEMDGLELRLRRELREMELQRDREFSKMNQRHNNIKQTILGQHSLTESKAKAFLSKKKQEKSVQVQDAWNKSLTDSSYLWATTNIKSESYQSRPFTVPIPVPCDPSSFSEITKSVVNSILQKERYSQKGSRSTSFNHSMNSSNYRGNRANRKLNMSDSNIVIPPRNEKKTGGQSPLSPIRTSLVISDKSSPVGSKRQLHNSPKHLHVSLTQLNQNKK